MRKRPPDMGVKEAEEEIKATCGGGKRVDLGSFNAFSGEFPVVFGRKMGRLHPRHPGSRGARAFSEQEQALES
jgi:hypothetical protein